jgi:hypothetical protein
MNLLQMALKFLEGAARDGFAAAYALIGKVTIFFCLFMKICALNKLTCKHFLLAPPIASGVRDECP